MRSDVANDPSRVVGARISLAVAKKLTLPPTKLEERHAIATRDSNKDKPNEGNLVQIAKDVQQPIKDDKEAIRNGKATVRMEVIMGSSLSLTSSRFNEDDLLQ
jgi:hypothetical protein